MPHALNMEEVFNLSRYPFFNSSESKRQALLQDCQEKLKTTGSCEFPEFVTPAALDTLTTESRALAKGAFFKTVHGNAYLAPGDDTLPATHPLRMIEDTTVGVVAYDEYPQGSMLKAIYEFDPLMQFIGDILQLKTIYRYADPMGALNLSVMRKGDYLRWHFDQTDFVTSLSIESSESGGEFEFVPLIRDKNNENYDDIRKALLNEHPGIINIANKPGTLVLFKGRYSIHRVTRITGDTPRLMGLLAYDEHPNINSTDHLRMMRYGRTQPKTKS
jgi:hypothetical protein